MLPLLYVESFLEILSDPRVLSLAAHLPLEVVGSESHAVRTVCLGVIPILGEAFAAPDGFDAEPVPVLINSLDVTL